MRLTVLGAGTCVPSATRGSAGFWLEAGDARVRLDCGAGSVHAMARFGISCESVSHQFISHFHIDHVGELPALLFALRWGLSTPRTAPFSLIGPVGLRALVEQLATIYGEPLLEQQFPLTLSELASGDALPLADGATLRVCKTPHNGESLAVRIDAGGRALGYTGDTAPSVELARFFAGVDLLIAECSFLDDNHGTHHLLADETAELARAANARRLVVTHAYFDPLAADLAARLSRLYAGPIFIAADGDVFDV